MRRIGWRGLVLASLMALGVAQASAAAPPTPSLTLATTTSTQDSGLLDVLVPAFEKETGVRVKVIAVGTGQALALGRRGDADVLLVHARAAEDAFVAQGYGVDRRDVMYNDFLLVGPAADPAGVRSTHTAAAALARIAGRRSTFVSRGDDSGTHKKEQELWRAARVQPSGEWYLRAGAGMGEVLRMASERGAYTLSDRATFLAQQKGLQLVTHLEGDRALFNPYGVIAVNPRRLPGVNYAGARRFIQFLMSPPAQRLIADFGRARYGQPLFHIYPKHDPAGLLGPTEEGSGMTRLAWIGLWVVLLSPQATLAQDASFRLGGDVEKARDWTVARIQSELSGSVQTVRYAMKGEEHTAKAVPLWAVVEAAQPRFDPQQKNHRVGFAIIVRARDGYTAAFSLAELAPDMGNEKVWLALEVDGKPLPTNDGPVRLLVPGEGGGHLRRWIFGIESITVVDGKRVSSPRVESAR
jgi:tungstate transport system substrate-binding protein